MLQFSSEYTSGRCAFADRYQFRCEMSWRSVPGEPDYPRMVSDYLHKLEREKKISGAKRLSISGWHGFTGTSKKECTSRFGRYLAESGCLIEIVLLWPDARDAACEAAILGSIMSVPVDHDNCRLWRSFGMELRVPSSAAFEGCTALPARVELSFTDTRTRNTWQFSRFGMLSAWFDGDLSKWLGNNLGKTVRQIRYTQRDRRGSNLLLAEGTYKPQALHLRHGQFAAVAWVEAADGRLYCAKKFIRRAAPGTGIPIEQLIDCAR